MALVRSFSYTNDLNVFFWFMSRVAAAVAAPGAVVFLSGRFQIESNVS